MISNNEFCSKNLTLRLGSASYVESGKLGSYYSFMHPLKNSTQKPFENRKPLKM